MNKIITLFVCGMAAVILVLVAARWLTYSRKKSSGNMDLPTTICTGGIVGAGALIMYRVMLAAAQAVDIWDKLKPTGALKSIATTCCLMMGIGMCWLLLLAGITAAFIALVMVAVGRENRAAEVDELAYMLVKTVLLSGVGVVMLPVLDRLLALCLPAYNLSYFH